MKKVLAILLAASMLFIFAACGGDSGKDNPTTTTGAKQTEATKAPTDSAAASTTESAAVTTTTTEAPFVRPTEYVRADDGEVYEAALGEYAELIADAKASASIDEKFVKFAKAEAVLLDSAVMIPTTTRGGRYAISRVAPRTVPYVQWGNDDDRLKSNVIIADAEFITKEERAELLDQWAKAVKGEGTYDPAAYLKGKGHTLANSRTLTFTTAPVTFDWLKTSSQSDTEVTVNTVDGLVEYNNLNQMKPALATSWDISDDGLTYTFHIRQGVKWYTAEGKEYAELTAKDFEAGFHHMLDAKGGLEWLVDEVVVGAYAYYAEGGSWDDVGYKAVDDYTLQVTLIAPTSYFLTMLSYSCFLPICESFYLSKGGVYGVTEYAEASADSTKYTYGLNTDVGSQVYCGSHLITKFQADSEIILTKNPGYYRADEVTMDTLRWVFDKGDNYVALYEDTVKGVYAGTNLIQSVGTLDLAKADGNFEKYGYITDTESTSFFGGLNLNRGTFALESGNVASAKTVEQKIDTTIALNNKNFRQAVQFAFDKATYNAVSNGEDLKLTSLRNMYTHPEFVSISADTTVDGVTFKAGTFYGDMVQYYLEQMGSPIQVADGIDGWYHPEEAKKAFEAAKPELEAKGVTFPVIIDVVYQSTDEAGTAQAQAYKQSIEGVLGAENVTINLVEATTREDFYASGYRASNGEAGNFDMFYGSGWGPDFGDPCTYLDTFLGYGKGYMTKVIGLF